jgi:hypothetical protein
MSLRDKTLAVFAAGLGAAIAVLPLALPAAAQKGPGWTVLVDGKTMGDQWTQNGEANWRIEDGALVADKGKGGHLVSTAKYKDFEIHAEFYALAETNSGIFIRCADPKKIGAKDCYEVNIWDLRKDPSYGTGGIVNFSEVKPMPKAGGKWNTMVITAKGRDITVTLNGKRTAKLRNGMFEEGHFTLQFGGNSGPIKFRKVAIKTL